MYFQATSVLSLAMAAGALAQFRLQVRPSFQARQLDQQISANSTANGTTPAFSNSTATFSNSSSTTTTTSTTFLSTTTTVSLSATTTVTMTSTSATAPSATPTGDAATGDENENENEDGDVDVPDVPDSADSADNHTDSTTGTVNLEAVCETAAGAYYADSCPQCLATCEDVAAPDACYFGVYKQINAVHAACEAESTNGGSDCRERAIEEVCSGEDN